MGRAWENYENVARCIVEKYRHEFGLISVEGKQKLKGMESGTTWEIDAKGVCDDSGIYVVIECRRYKRRQSQDKLAALAYVIKDTGASGGIIVSELGLQEGAKKIAESENIVSVKLDKNSTLDIFKVEFLDKVIHGTTGHINLPALKGHKTCTSKDREAKKRQARTSSLTNPSYSSKISAVVAP